MQNLEKNLEGRIIKGVGGNYFVATEDKTYTCSIRGVFRKGKIIPTVGDYVTISLNPDETGIIEKIHSRNNILIRPKVANIDCAVITFAIINPNINADLLDRFLVLAETQNISQIVICVNKCDLASEKDLENIKNIYGDIYEVVFTDTINNTHNGIEKLKEIINNKVTVFAGPSGVGKSSLINAISNTDLKIGEISNKIKRGKHTTRQVELLEAWDNTYIVDTPGFTSLSMEYIQVENFSQYFREFQPYLSDCKFCDCKHIHEPDCGIKSQLGKSISQQRYNRYKALFQELEDLNK